MNSQPKPFVFSNDGTTVLAVRSINRITIRPHSRTINGPREFVLTADSDASDFSVCLGWFDSGQAAQMHAAEIVGVDDPPELPPSWQTDDHPDH